jgi:hypothetical protein
MLAAAAAAAAAQQCGPSIKAYPWPAEELLRCTTGNTGLAGGEVDRPSVLKHPLFPLALLAFIVVGEHSKQWRCVCNWSRIDVCSVNAASSRFHRHPYAACMCPSSAQPSWDTRAAQASSRTAL